MSNVKLAIRVRPFTDREQRSEKERVSVVSVIDDYTVTITNVKVSASGAGDSRERVRRYTADYTFDSACGLDERRYASQDTVFKSIGSDVLATLGQAASCCVLAYGQSATGKTHTMMGSEAQPGLVPRLGRALLAGGAELTVSFLEIYNERVHDLLVGEELLSCGSLPRRRGNARKDLRVREHPERGTYVQNLRRVVVTDAETLLGLVSEGTRRRRTAATRRNSASSRSHAILELATPRATLHLADLAGSEKASWEGCGGGRQKEGANINKSLVALSNVISALVGAGGARGRFVPYRDSALTWLLRDCFTGGARTFIIATVSPSVACYGESASTLRWAARARQLPPPRAPHHPAQATRAALHAQLTRLLEELARQFIRYIPDTGKIFYDENHWNLRPQNNSQLLLQETYPEEHLLVQETYLEEDKIGNIMKPFYTKTDAPNSESTASSIASGSSDVINTLDKSTNEEIAKEINEEMDKLFGPSLERARSGGDLKVVAPYRNKRRQYRSQEVLQIDKPNVGQTERVAPLLESKTQNKEQAHTMTDHDSNVKTQHVPIIYDNNQRAEIVASVTERLYSKLKKKEQTAAAKMESIVDKKIVEPLSELRICTNARQRLMELSQKAMRNKRRIGIPAHTQTRKMAIRVREQGVDVQTDLEPYYIKERNVYAPHQDVGTETAMITPRCREAAVGPKYGSLRYKDMSTVTEENNALYRSSLVMTDNLVTFDRCTQTIMVPPPRRKRRMSAYAKYIKSDLRRRNSIEQVETPVINISILQAIPAESDTQPSDESTDNIVNAKTSTATMPPDLITNHNKIDTVNEHQLSGSETEQRSSAHELNSSTDHRDVLDDFPAEDYSLPRVSPALLPTDHTEMQDIILGRNDNIFPYNIILSPPREPSAKRIVKFKDVEIRPQLLPVTVASQTQTGLDWGSNGKRSLFPELLASAREYGNYTSDTVHPGTSSDSTDSSKLDSNDLFYNPTKTFSASVNSKSFGYLCNGRFSPVYKHGTNNIRSRSAKAKFYREFLGLEKETGKDESSSESKDSYSDSEQCNKESVENFKRKKQFFEKAFERKYFEPKDIRSFSDIEKNILKSCDRLESSVNKYDQNMSVHRQSSTNCSFRDRGARRPRDYLQHLVQLRREFVKDQNAADDYSQ